MTPAATAAVAAASWAPRRGLQLRRGGCSQGCSSCGIGGALRLEATHVPTLWGDG